MRRPLRFLKKKKKRVSLLKRRPFWYGTALLFLFTFLFYAVVFSPWLEIQEVKVQGINEIPAGHIIAAVEQGFWQSFLGIPQNSILLVQIKELEKGLANAFPLLSEVFLERSFPHTLLIKVQEREQVAAWCLYGAGKDSFCFALDKEGVVFKEVEDTREYVVIRSAGNPMLGQQLVDGSVLFALLEFQETFQQAREPIRVSIAVFEIGEKRQVQAITREGWRILLDLSQDMEWQQAKLKIVLEQKVSPEKRGSLEYIDLRFGGHAYLKYRE